MISEQVVVIDHDMIINDSFMHEDSPILGPIEVPYIEDNFGQSEDIASDFLINKQSNFNAPLGQEEVRNLDNEQTEKNASG